MLLCFWPDNAQWACPYEPTTEGTPGVTEDCVHRGRGEALSE